MPFALDEKARVAPIRYPLKMPVAKKPKQYWLVKSEPFKYSWDEFVKDGWTYWDSGASMASLARDLELLRELHFQVDGLALSAARSADEAELRVELRANPRTREARSRSENIGACGAHLP